MIPVYFFVYEQDKTLPIGGYSVYNLLAIIEGDYSKFDEVFQFAQGGYPYRNIQVIAFRRVPAMPMIRVVKLDEQD